MPSTNLAPKTVFLNLSKSYVNDLPSLLSKNARNFFILSECCSFSRGNIIDSNTETSSEAHSSVNILNVSSSVSEATTPDQQAQNTESGLTVRIEPIHSGKGTIDVSQIKLRAPFPAKALAQAPQGWHFDASNNASLYRHDVEIAEGSKITLTIQPHVLVPDSDGQDVFSIAEPGYEADLGYQQISTIDAIVSNSVRQLDEDAQKIGVAIDDLQQLLISLPKPVEVAPIVSQDAQVEKSAPNRKR